MEFDHAGIATRDAGATAERLGAIVDAPLVHEEQFDGMNIAFLAVGDGYIELIEPDSESPIDAYLDRNGPGIHHLAFATDDVGAALERADERGVRLIDETPREGAWGHTVAFLHPASTDGVLIEYVEH